MRGCIVVSASPSSATAVSLAEGCNAIDPADPRVYLVRSERRQQPARASADAGGVSNEHWQSDLRSCMRAMNSTLTHLMRSIAEGQMLTAQSEARCLSKQAHTLNVLLAQSLDVNL